MKSFAPRPSFLTKSFPWTLPGTLGATLSHSFCLETVPLTAPSLTKPCTLFEAEIRRLWQGIVLGESVPWLTARWRIQGALSPHKSSQTTPERPGRIKSLDTLKQGLSEGLAFWLAKQNAGSQTLPWKLQNPQNPIQISPATLALLDGLLQGKTALPKPQTVGDRLIAWIIGDWCQTWLPPAFEALAQNNPVESRLLWAACHPLALGLSKQGPTEPSHELNFDLFPWIEGALATRLAKAWKVYHLALKESPNLTRIGERAQWAVATRPVWDLLIQGNSPYWIRQLCLWVGEILGPLGGLSDAFAPKIEWKGAPFAKRQHLRGTALLALGVGTRMAEKFEQANRVGYLDDTYHEAQGYLLPFHEATDSHWMPRISAFLRELAQDFAPEPALPVGNAP